MLLEQYWEENESCTYISVIAWAAMISVMNPHLLLAALWWEMQMPTQSCLMCSSVPGGCLYK